MSSRENILSAIAKNQPVLSALPDNLTYSDVGMPLEEKFTTVSEAIGSKVVAVSDYDEIKAFIASNYASADRIMSPLAEFADIAENDFSLSIDPHTFENIDLAILKPHFAVAENGSCWLTEELMGQRVVPFICQYLALIVNQDEIVATMHQAYEKISSTDYGYGAFIAGPSKTADIEQSLVLGAHGPRSMTIFLIK